MRGTWWAVLLLVPLSGCLGFLEPEEQADDVTPADVIDQPDTYKVDSVVITEMTVESADGTSLSTKVYEPITRDSREDGSPIQFPVMILLHPWGYAKEYFENIPMGMPTQEQPDPRVNVMQEFAERGFITVAFDNRGFGRSEGQVTIAGQGEMEDIEAVRQKIDGPAFNDNDHFGVAGVSLGAGTALRAWATNPNIHAVGSVYGWYDLYDAILPGNVPKSEWGVSLFATGTALSGGQLSPEISSWLARAVQRSDLTGVEAEMDTHSARGFLPQTDKPLFQCQGLQETLFPQLEIGLEESVGFTRSLVFTGGHGEQDTECWDHIMDFMDFFLRGVDNGVPTWPFLETIDSDPDAPTLTVSEAQLARTGTDVGYLHEGFMVEGPSNRRFTVSQRLTNNPLQEPSVVGDQIGGSYQAIPESLRQDPFAVFFDSGPLDATTVFLGNPQLSLTLADGMDNLDFQVVATLYSVDEGGDSRPVSRGAYAHVAGATTPVEEIVEIPMTWTKTTVPTDGRLVLKLSANDSGFYLPLQKNYDVTFTGASSLSLPIFEG